MMYLGVEGLYDEVAHHTIYLSKNYEQNLRDIEQRHTLSDDPSFYVQNACVTDPSLAPRGCSTLYVLAPVTHETANVDWAKQQTGFRRQVLDQVAKIGIKDLEQRIRFEKIISPKDWQTDYALYRGATFSMAHNLGQMLHLRPHNRFEDLDGVYLVGGGTHPGSGLPVIFESARITSRLLLEDMNVQPVWVERPEVQAAPMYEAAS
jgi:phytoene desaturase